MYEINFENRLQEIKNRIKNYKLELELLKSITFKTKKNGEPFTKIENNFEFNGFNARIVKDSVGLNGYDYHIYFHNQKTLENGTLYVNGYRNLEYDYRAKEYIIPEGVAPERIIKQTYLKPYYMLNFEELKQELEEMKESHIEWIEKEEKHLQEFSEAKEDIIKFEKEIKEKFPTLSWYDLKDLIFFT